MIFYNAQYGFRNELSAECAIFVPVNKVIGRKDNMNKAINLFLELSKVFDSLEQTIVL